jgi:hypothetical protein
MPLPLPAMRSDRRNRRESCHPKKHRRTVTACRKALQL